MFITAFYVLLFNRLRLLPLNQGEPNMQLGVDLGSGRLLHDLLRKQGDFE